jgi:hypothetical protein
MIMRERRSVFGRRRYLFIEIVRAFPFQTLVLLSGSDSRIFMGASKKPPLQGKVDIIACETIDDEIRKVNRRGFGCRFLEHGLHRTPDLLREKLQEAILQDREAETILLGYGLCSNGVVGLRSPDKWLIIPRVDDCISLLLGSRKVYLEHFKSEPGTYYLTKGWIDHGKTPYSQYHENLEKYDPETALWVAKELLKNYTRIALIDTGAYDLNGCRCHAEAMAAFFGLRLEVVPGTIQLLHDLVKGRWNKDFLVIEPGCEVTEAMFRP